ncbi:MAG: hypothetical protein IJB11_06655 [Oscillospiraceae bacterium]|nr:hypothetical protein [Oscillospiraceae bacterium]
MAKIKPENCTNCDWFDRMWDRCTNPDSLRCGEWVGVSDKCGRFTPKEVDHGK